MRIHELVKGMRIRRKRRLRTEAWRTPRLRVQGEEESEGPRRKRPGRPGWRRPREYRHLEAQGRNGFKGREHCPCQTLAMGQVR